MTPRRKCCITWHLQALQQEQKTNFCRRWRCTKYITRCNHLGCHPQPFPVDSTLFTSVRDCAIAWVPKSSGYRLLIAWGYQGWSGFPNCSRWHLLFEHFISYSSKTRKFRCYRFLDTSAVPKVQYYLSQGATYLQARSKLRGGLSSEGWMWVVGPHPHFTLRLWG